MEQGGPGREGRGEMDGPGRGVAQKGGEVDWCGKQFIFVYLFAYCVYFVC